MAVFPINIEVDGQDIKTEDILMEKGIYQFKNCPLRIPIVIRPTEIMKGTMVAPMLFRDQGFFEVSLWIPEGITAQIKDTFFHGPVGVTFLWDEVFKVIEDFVEIYNLNHYKKHLQNPELALEEKPETYTEPVWISDQEGIDEFIAAIEEQQELILRN